MCSRYSSFTGTHKWFTLGIVHEEKSFNLMYFMYFNVVVIFET